MSRSGKYDIHKIRNQVREKVGKKKDPTEFRPPKAEDGQPAIQFRFFVLPPFAEGDELATGPATQGMEEFFIRNGSHYLDNKRLGCPRVINDDECPICQHGFDLMKETEVKDQRRDIAKRLLPGTYYMVNIYFPNIDKNPEELRGQVRWYNCPKTVFDIWEDCLYRDDDGGDPQEPLPFGVFYDEEEAYLFRLEVVKQGQANSYTKSKFFLTESLQAVPIGGKAGHPDHKKIIEILSKRHDLFDKVPDVSAADIEGVARNLTGDGDDSSSGFDADETQDKKVVKERKTKKKSGLKPAVSESSASTKTKVKPVDDVDDLAGLDEEPVKEPVVGEVPADEEPPFNEKEAEPEARENDGDDDDVDALLDQLGDD